MQRTRQTVATLRPGFVMFSPTTTFLCFGEELPWPWVVTIDISHIVLERWIVNRDSLATPGFAILLRA